MDSSISQLYFIYIYIFFFNSCIFFQDHISLFINKNLKEKKLKILYPLTVLNHSIESTEQEADSVGCKLTFWKQKRWFTDL